MRRAVREELKSGAHQIKAVAGGGVATPSDPIDMVQYTAEEIGVAVQEAAARRTYAFAHAYVPDAIIQAGVRVGFGTCLLGETHPAQSRELLRRAEVQSPRDVLRSATAVNAELLGQPGQPGTLAPGAYADLLLVDGNPLEDLAVLTEHEQGLAMVMRNGDIVVDKRGS